MHKLIIIAALPALLLTSACDDRTIGKATIGFDGETLTFDGDRSACLTRVTIRTTGLIDREDPDDGYVWELGAAEGEGDAGCMHFPIVYGSVPAHGEQELPPRGFAPNGEYQFEAVSPKMRYQRDFQPVSSGNSIFYVEDANGSMTDIRKAQQ